MKNLGDKFKKIGKSIGKTARKGALLGALALGSVTYASGQEIDRTELPGMDFYSRTNIVNTNAYGSGDVNDDGNVNSLDLQAMDSGVKNDYSDLNGNGVQSDFEDKHILGEYLNRNINHLPSDWNNLNRLEKIDWLTKMLSIDKTDELPYIPGFFECTDFAYLTQFNFGGMENINNFQFLEKYQSRGLKNNRFGIPAYNISVTANKSPDDASSEGEGHRICGIFIGPEGEKEGEKENPFDFNQWYFFEPQNDIPVKIGDWNMDKNGDAVVYWMSWQPNVFGQWQHTNNQMIHFELSGGSPYVPENHFDSDLLRENPHTEKLKLSPLENKNIERDSNEPALSMESTGKPAIETSLIYYAPALTNTDSEKEYFDSRYPEYFSFTRKFMADVKMGRWNKKDSLEQKIIVDDTTSPTVENFEGQSDLEYMKSLDIDSEINKKISNANVHDASPYPVQKEMNSESTQVMDGSAQQVNYDVNSIVKFSDVRGNFVSQTHKFKVRDTKAPELELESGDVTIKKGEDPLLAIKVDYVQDNSELPVEVSNRLNESYPEGIIEESNNFRKYSVLTEAVDVSGNKKTIESFVTEDLGTGIEELKAENKGVDVDILGNPVNSNTKFRVATDKFLKDGKIYVTNMKGQTIDIIDVHNLDPYEEREIDYSGFGSRAAGTYIVNFIGNGEKDTEKAVKR